MSKASARRAAEAAGAGAEVPDVGSADGDVGAELRVGGDSHAGRQAELWSA